MKTLLQIIVSATRRLGLSEPNAAYTSTDPQIIQLVDLLNEEGKDLAAKYPWQALTEQVSFTTLATEVQGDINTLAPGFNYIINDTIWNRSLRRPVYGPRTPQSWEQQQAFAINGPWSSFRIYGDDLRMYPVPDAGQTCYFEYITNNWIDDGATGASEWTADTDTPKLPDEILLLGLLWRWKQVKGLEYAEDFNKYERRVLDYASRDAGKDWLNLTNTKYDIYPGVVVPSGSWNIP